MNKNKHLCDASLDSPNPLMMMTTTRHPGGPGFLDVSIYVHWSFWSGPHLSPTTLGDLIKKPFRALIKFSNLWVCLWVIQAHQLLWYQSCHSVKRWILALICKVWEVTWDLWEHRNGIKHDSSNHLQLQHTASLELRIWQEFATRLGMLPRAKSYLFPEMVTTILSQSLASQEAWLRSVTEARASAYWCSTQGYEQEWAFMRCFLGLP
jgi:hypothetical protein